MAQSAEERKKKKREAEKRRRQRIKEDSAAYKAEQLKKHERYLAAKEKKKKKKITDREKRIMRRKWRHQQRSYREKKRILAMNSSEGTTISRQKQVWKKKNAGKRSKVYRDNELLKLSNLHLSKQYARYKQKYFRLQSQTTSNSPRSKVNKFLKQAIWRSIAGS